ncbi:hypothetical protein WR25_24630 [Diploscapter pachys]|uniref:Fe2OG dioxygenase domain-containing protein n=1 Tax=Diploscapter pachys TaxID=2018661 RepID=A0A2A2JZP3_9BILA|nr:hypothetical protein WR25_24630 [Diploscapter pachys]
MKLEISYSLLFSLFAIENIESHGDSNGNGFSFLGDEHWEEVHRNLCDNPYSQTLYQRPDLACYQNSLYYNQVKMEVLSWHPFLIVLRDFVSQVQINRFLDDIFVKRLEEQKVVDENDASEQYHLSRRANGTWFEHRETLGTSQMYEYTTDMLPYINFEVSELWQNLFKLSWVSKICIFYVLSYRSGGHYAPHYDYLEYHSKDHWDWWMTSYGNRFATFLLILKTADEGGGTVFPRLNVTIVPNPGDAILWANMNLEGGKEEDALHGACPIKKGEKIAATLWIRQHDQLFDYYCAGFPPKNFADRIIDPLYFMTQS